MKKMANSDVVGVILPGTTFFLGQTNYVDAKKMIDVGCEVALATDFNPGSCTINSLPQIMFRDFRKKYILKDKNLLITCVTRENYEEARDARKYDILINAAMPSKRFWAKNNPYKDFL